MGDYRLHRNSVEQAVTLNENLAVVAKMAAANSLLDGSAASLLLE